MFVSPHGETPPANAMAFGGGGYGRLLEFDKVIKVGPVMGLVAPRLLPAPLLGVWNDSPPIAPQSLDRVESRDQVRAWPLPSSTPPSWAGDA